jgi:hypothetical protein
MIVADNSRNSRFGEFNSRLGGGHSRFGFLRELVRKPLLWLDLFLAEGQFPRRNDGNS